MNGFKLIAIRPTSRCDKNYLKVLKINTPYVFYNEYDFSNYNEKTKKIKKREIELVDLFSFKTKKKIEVKVNISAIVGENGSGKSSLVELFYITCYNISAIKGILYDEYKERYLTSRDRVKNINVEFFYEINNNTYLTKLRDSSISQYILEGDIFILDKNEFNLNDFFYTIAINYSLHSLNSEILGLWVKKIFHKNDGYQTPIVLNPYRDKGNINVNKEEYLVRSRLISNILGKTDKNVKAEDSLRNIIDGKIAYRLHIELNRDKFKFDKDEKPKFILTNLYGSYILPVLYHHFLKTREFIPQDTILNKYAIEYILYKLKSIAEKYQPYKNLFSTTYELEEGDAEGYFRMLSEDKSHITFKLRQAINFLKNELYFKKGEKFDLTVSYLSNQLTKKMKVDNNELIDILPPAFFDVDIEFKNGDRFKQLSSGEKQRIFSLSTLVYHLSNINSTSKVAVLKYKTANIIFDELELYFHPDLQRTLINDILENIKKINLTDVLNINILFVTHSPFILSDIPSHNILVLEKDGLPLEEGLRLETFGANIFDLLKHSFFLLNGPMGEFAKNKIKETIDWINNPTRNLQEKEYHKLIIKIIGEPILQTKLAEMFDIVIGEKFENEIIQKQILHLQNKLKQNS
ncbi:AAA family ATPase [Flavobacterium sp. SM2513]|uniref:AAA family ATPase n=1 Tax=Flavobacterium sp. SM2513 TaxID=3424766 RepID=UPI003D7FA8D7